MSVVAVTGGAGYVGSHAVKALALAGYDVVVYDDLSAGHVDAVARVAADVPRRNVTLVEGDVLDGPSLAGVLRRSGATAVLHFAARLSVGESVHDPLGYYRTNVAGTMSTLGAMADAGVERFVFSSTAATFGEPQRTPMDETHPQRPINPYGASKLAVERALPFVEHALGIRWVALRYFNAAGADPDGRLGEDHRPEEHLIPRAIRAAGGGPPLTVFGDDYDTPDGTCLRDYVHVTDLAAAHVQALDALASGRPSSAYNLGNGDGHSVRQVLAAVEAVVGRPVPHTIGPRREGDPARLVASSERARRELGWSPRYAAIETIVGTAWRWHEAHPDGYGRPGHGAE
ncbi:MAG: UDP-glucose 4-epimerase GalE [Vicinamibacterales bacterium]